MKDSIGWEDLSTKEIKFLREKAKKKQKKYTIIALLLLFVSAILLFVGVVVIDESVVLIAINLIITTIGSIYCGLAMYCINNIRALETRGRKGGGGFGWLMLLLIGGIIIPIITVAIVRKSDATSLKVLGWRG